MHPPLDLLVVLIRDHGRSDLDALPLKHLTTAGPVDWAPLRSVATNGAAPGTVVRLRRRPDGAVHLERRYDDVVELLGQDLPAEALVNALWAIWQHGVREEWPHTRAARAVGRLERHPDPRVRAEAVAAGGRL